ncbi:MAG: MFS transporter, partial [Anaerolineaceae bacterium]|nr:MFS transporter [Anaerolineaceae bacterium]
LLIIGLVVYLISGVAGGFSTSIAMLLITRSILGVAVGIITPLSVSLITDFYYGEERAQMMGYAQAARSLSGALTTPLIGLVAAANWRNIFWVYTLALPVILGVLWILPEPKMPEAKEEQIEKPSPGLPKAVWMYAIFMFLQRTAFYVMPTNLSVYLLENEFGGSGLAGMAISVDTLSSFMVGLLFAWLFKKQGRWMGMSSLVAMSCGYFALVIAKGTPMIFAAMALIGFGQGQLIPLLLFETAQAVPAEKRTSAIALVSSTQFLGQFVTPFLFNAIGWIMGDSSIQMMFIVTAVMLMIVVILQMAMNLRKGFLFSKS